MIFYLRGDFLSVNFELIGKRIQSHRKNLKKTQESMAEYLDVSVGYVSLIERGKTKISLSTLAKIADFLDCKISELVDNVSTNNSSYLNDEIYSLINNLNNKEKELLLKLINSYLDYNKQKNNG